MYEVRLNISDINQNGHDIRNRIHEARKWCERIWANDFNNGSTYDELYGYNSRWSNHALTFRFYNREFATLFKMKWG